MAAYYRLAAPFLDAELKDRGDLGFWRAIAERFRGARVLELGCGTGRVTELLAERAARVVGVDLSADMLERAARRIAGLRNVDLVQADMRSLALRERFGLVVAADDPFCHLTDDADRSAAVAVVASHLAQDGRFVLDALWCPGMDRSPRALRRRRVPFGGAVLQVAERWECRPGARACLASYRYRLDGREVAQCSFRAACWSAAEVDRRLALAGLKIVSRRGSYRGAPWRPGASGNLIVEAAPA